MDRTLSTRWFSGLMLTGWLASVAIAQDSGSYPKPKNLGDATSHGDNIQRTMSLLASSTPEQRNTVRILFYGQSITEQKWADLVMADLRQRFPDANLIMENRALGGFSSQRLVKTAETDLYPFYPDLLIFHVYGAHTEYEDIIRRTRERTTAEILIQTDHVSRDQNWKNESTDPHTLPNDWNSFFNYNFLPGVVQKYGCGVVDQRNLWKEYLAENNLEAGDLLKDGVHLNEHGEYLMAELVKAELVRRESVMVTPMDCGYVTTVPLASGTMANETAQLDIEGNRIDLVFKDDASSAVDIRIDGKKPSEFPALYGFTRALPKPGSKWPVIADLSSEAPLILENWTMDVRKDAEKEGRYLFKLTGSKTGEDGSGNSEERFVSNSKRVVIDPSDWDVEFAMSTLAGVKPIPDEFTVRWSVVPYFEDSPVPPQVMDAAVERTITVAQGLEDGPHRIELLGAGVDGVDAVRVYSPAKFQK